MQYLSLLCRKRKADVGDYWFIYNKLYDASDEGHAQVIQKYLENDPEISSEDLEYMYNSNQHFRDYALNKLDGIRIAQDQVEVGKLDASVLNKIRKAFLRIYDEEAYNMKIGIQDNRTKTYYFNIPFDDVDGSSINKLRRYKMYGAKKRQYLSLLCRKRKASFSPQIDDTMSGWITPSGKVLVLSGEESHLQKIRELYSKKEYLPSEEAISKYNKGETKRILPEVTQQMAIYDGYIRLFGGHNDLWIGTPENTISFEVSSMSEVQILQKYIVRGLLKASVKNIEVETLNRRYYFTGTPQEFIDTGLDANLHRKISKKADFSGDFQNVYDIRPDPGNVIPGRNREYVKQQTDFFPHKTSGEDDEFVHTHPEHCPRYDLRKLKIVDDPDESESKFSEDGE